MPVLLTNKSYTDEFGNTLTYYNTNVGDKCTLSLEFETNIKVSTQIYPMFLDTSNNQITSTAINFLDEGFRDGDTVRFTAYSSTGGILAQWSTSIQALTATMMDVGTILGFMTTGGSYTIIEVTSRNRDDLDVYFNQVLNSMGANIYSMIDAEPTRINFPGVDSLAVSGTINGIPIPNQSGQFFESATITRLANPSTYTKKYELELSFYNSGIYDSAWFSTGECLKNVVQLSWAAIDNEPYNRYIYNFSENADTGYFNEGYNSQISDVTLISGITTLDYSIPSTHNILITASAGYEGVGAAYVSLDSTYYKNNQYDQQSLTMLFYTQALSTTAIASESNPTGAFYELELVTPVTVIGSIYTVQLNFIPDPSFTQFMDSRELGDRRMQIWCKFGNTNALVFDGQVTSQATGDVALEMEQNIFIDHSDNTTTSTSTAYGYEADTEDDLAFCGVTLFKLNDEYNNLTASIVAKNTMTDDEFTLTSAFWDISSIPFVGGVYQVVPGANVVPVQSQLPTTSEKRNAYIQFDASYDTMTHYGVRIYFPFLLRWEYWLQQLNANIVFYPDQNKNWQAYPNVTDWELQLKLRLTSEESNYSFYDTIIDKDYNKNVDNLIQDILLERVSTGQIVGIVTEGEMMKVIGTHTLNDGSIWDYPNVWGMITVEPYEASQRWISSTVIDYDFDSNNPLTPLAGETRCKMTLTAPNQITLECLFNPDKIDLSNGVSFTTKIKGCQDYDNPYKLLTDGQYKMLTDGQFKKLS
jgi:hypothetical protein